MKRHLANLVVFGLAVCSAIGLPLAGASAATKAERDRAAARMVQDALRREIDGVDSVRNKLLRSVLEQTPGYAPALWHSGFVEFRNKWLKFDELPKVAAQDARLTAYRQQRQKYPDTVEGQLALADWCGKKGLPDQRRAHLTRVLDLEPDHVEARRLLGYRQVDGTWMTQEEISQSELHAKEAEKTLRQWKPKLLEIRNGLAQRGRLQRQSAADRLLAIRDPAAIAAMESLLARHDEPTALLVVQALEKMTAHEASVALARQAVSSPWQSVRKAASEKLSSKPLDDYVPEMLAAMGTPVQSRAQLYAAPNGRPVYRHVFLREAQDHNELAVFDTEYDGDVPSARNPAALAGRRSDSAQALQLDAATKALSREMAVARENAAIQEFNSRVCETLATATGQNLPASPDLWWKWWNDHNEVYTAGTKPLKTSYSRETVVIAPAVETIGSSSEGSGGGSSAGSASTFECLAAGTPVWTDLGPVPIEQIKVGDRVLAQDPETGQLACKPVLRTTTRPAEILVRIEAGSQSIQCSGGHPFWVSGEGWLKARQLKSGMPLHGICGTLPVRSVYQSGYEPTYNLIVADFHSYFVGDAKILSHDNTIRKPTGVRVPGLNVMLHRSTGYP